MSQQINLFNPVFMQQRKYFSAATMLQALGLILVGSLLVYGYALYQVHQLQVQSREVTRRFSDEQLKLAQTADAYSPQQSGQLLAEQLQKAQARLAAQQKVIKTLKGGAIGNTTGYSEYLRAFARQTLPGLWLTGFSVTGDAAQMSLSGGVTDPGLVPAFIHRLNREAVMQGKTFAALQMHRPENDEGGSAGAKDRTNHGADYVEFTLYSSESGKAAK